MSDEFITTEDYINAINAIRSPPLEPAQPNYRSTETPPPPLDDSDDNYDSDVTETKGEGGHAWKCKPSKGPDYPDVAIKAGREFFTLSPETACEDRRPPTAATPARMLAETVRRGLSGTADENLARAAFEASEKLNAAIHDNGRGGHTTTILQSITDKHGASIYVREIEPETIEIVNGVRRRSIEMKYPMPQHLSLGHSSSRSLNVRPPPKVSLPAIRTDGPRNESSRPRSEWASSANESLATSPALAKFTITPADGNPQQQLPRMQTSPQQSLVGLSPGRNQTLPSLETALSQISDNEVAPYSAHSSISRPSPVQYSQFGPPSASYSNPSPASARSPPRPSATRSYWQTIAAETSDSTPSDQTSNIPSAGISTPASSYFGHSPSNSVSTPATIVPDADNVSAVSGSSSQPPDVINPYNGSFKCAFPSCNAPPFQTQYLLNSHANVHSNTRPHFCPVQGCPRGPGGQGFKRKNEMIRHGLVHQSPGYVCPFCPDQQHKYPRPDNLQRHVRVHHVDKDRDDPLLRDVLAQRPEGGNRGRRRRLGS